LNIPSHHLLSLTTVRILYHAPNTLYFILALTEVVCDLGGKALDLSLLAAAVVKARENMLVV